MPLVKKITLKIVWERLRHLLPIFAIALQYTSAKIYWSLNYGMEIGRHLPYFIATAGIDVLLLCLPLILFYKKVKRYYWFLTALSILFFINGIVKSFHGADLNYFIINAALTTNSAELGEFLTGIPAWIYIVNFLMLGIYVISLKWTPKDAFITRKEYFIVIGALLILLSSAILYRGLSIGDSLTRLKEKSIFYQFGWTAQQWIKYQPNNSKKNSDTYNAKLNSTSQSSKRKIHVLVIGESSRKDYWSHYKPENSENKLNLTPRLAQDTSLIWFEDVMASINFTDMAVTMLLTPASPENFTKHSTTYSIAKAYSECNFNTFFLTNQADQFVHEGNMAYHLNEFDTIINTRSHSLTNVYDEALLDPLKKIVSLENQNDLFVVIHTMGSHFEYFSRYPRNRVLVKDSVSHDPQWKKACYQNSIYYTDSILAEIINIIDEKDVSSWVWYISDHGETMPEDKMSGYFNHLEAHKKNIAIPSFLWISSEYKLKNQEKCKFVEQNRTKKLNSGHLIHSILDLSNIGWRNADPTLSIGKDECVDHPRYLLDQNVNYVHFDSLQ